VLGWYRKGTFGAAFDKAVENASAGSVIGPVRGPGGYHVIRVLDKTSLAFDVAEVEQEVSYSSSTRDSIYGLANLFVDKLTQTRDINLAAEQMNMPGLNVFETTPPVTAKSRTVTGLQGGRELVLWAINSDEKEISKVFNIGTDYVVAQVMKQQAEGLPDVEAAREQVEVKLLNEKKAELILSKLSALSGDLNAMSSAYGPGAFVNTAQNVTFESPSIPGIGADKFLIGRVFGLGQGVTSKPIKGLNGVYVIQVSSITEASEPAPEAIATLKSSMNSTMQGILGSKITPALEEIGEVEDNRAKAEAISYGYR
jgi:peptidyl-prolyl cis-trans isomerase D